MERKRKLSSLPDVKEHLICGICSNIFDDPRNLACGHVFCKKCLDKYGLYGCIISCPTCRRDTVLSESGVNGLSRNLIIEPLHHDLSEEPGPSCKRPKRTSACIEHRKEQKDIYCSTCLVFICFKCFKENHSHHETKTRSEFMGELSQKTEDAKEKYRVQSVVLENLFLGIDKDIRLANNTIQLIKSEYEAKLEELKQNKFELLLSLTIKSKKMESGVAQLRNNGEQIKKSLAIAVANLESKTLLEDLDDEDLKSYVKNVHNVMDLLISVKHLSSGINLKNEHYRITPLAHAY